ncbi:MAG: OmpH family outer membrane protein [Proteobacteria bacterium]|nr:OmpH family outer membrane protein [Pseudomonadota bacterium]MDA1023536.1 OmpH family outer membrane protein [Pseudomonadota bacterium]
MKNSLKLLFVALLGFLFVISPSMAQQKTPAKDPAGKKRVVELPFPVAVLHVQSILSDAKAVKSIRDQVTKFGSSFEKEIQKERDAIRTANQELARQRTILAPEAFAEKRREFEQRVVEVQRLVQKRQRELDTSRNEAMAQVNSSYVEIVSAIAQEQNLALILKKDQTAFSVKTLDITQDVLSRLNKKLPTVKVKKPGKK